MPDLDLSRLTTILQDTLMEAWRNHPSDQPKDRVTSPKEVYFSVEKAVEALAPKLRDLLSAETQQIREERDALKAKLGQSIDMFGDTVAEAFADYRKQETRAEQAEAETQALREALEKCLSYEAVAAVCQGLSGCTCINQSRDTERNYETGNCAHQKAGVALQRLTQASLRTGEK